jgi:hypothetical protein
MAERDQSESARDVSDLTEQGVNDPSPSRNQGDGMEGSPTSTPGGEGESGRGAEGERGREGESDREGRGGYGNDTGFTGGTAGSRDDDLGGASGR